jgi:hypothetical protein
LRAADLFDIRQTISGRYAEFVESEVQPEL